MTLLLFLAACAQLQHLLCLIPVLLVAALGVGIVVAMESLGLGWAGNILSGAQQGLVSEAWEFAHHFPSWSTGVSCSGQGVNGASGILSPSSDPPKT